MRLRIIGNPIAGGGKAKPRIEELTRLLQERGHAVDVMLTTRAGDAVRWAGELPNDLDRLIVAGGDGTLNEVLNGLHDVGKLPIVQMPVGTANVLVRELKLPWKPAGVADNAERGVVRKVDLGEISNAAMAQSPRRFLVVMSAGFDAMVIEDIHANRKGKLGFFGYMKPIWRTIRRYSPPVLSVRVDDGEPVSGAMVVVANSRNYAGIFTVADKAAMDSGYFDVCVLPKGKILSLAGYALKAFCGGLSKARSVSYQRGHRVVIDSSEPVAVEVDGEYFGTTPVCVTIQPACVPIVVPAK